MRILVTGGAGFLGSHLCDYLIEQDHEVICIDNLITGSIENIGHLSGNESFGLLILVRHQPGSWSSSQLRLARYCADMTSVAFEYLRRAMRSATDSVPIEFVASDIRLALDCLGRVTGRNVTSKVLDEIFSRFCIGK